MGKYTAIADVGKTLVNLLKDQLVPQPMQKPEMIGICSPKERGAFVLGIHPYDIKEETGQTFDTPIYLPDGSIQNPPTSYELYYVISVASKAEGSEKAVDEQRILGRLLQVMNDNRVLPSKYMPDSLKLSNESVAVNMLKLELEDKVKIWSMFSEPYRLSAFFSVSPITIESAVIKSPKRRVSSVDISSDIMK